MSEDPTDIVARLRVDACALDEVCIEAADEIERLRADVLTVDTEMQQALTDATANALESVSLDANSYGAGYDEGQRDGLRRALCILRRLDDRP